MKCEVPGCRSDASDADAKAKIGFHLFPSNQELRRKWCTQIGRNTVGDGHWQPPNGVGICLLHFEEKDLERYRSGIRLRKGAIPTIFESSAVIEKWESKIRESKNKCRVSEPVSTYLSSSQVIVIPDDPVVNFEEKLAEKEYQLKTTTKELLQTKAALTEVERRLAEKTFKLAQSKSKIKVLNQKVKRLHRRVAKSKTMDKTPKLKNHPDEYFLSREFIDSPSGKNLKKMLAILKIK